MQKSLSNRVWGAVGTLFILAGLSILAVAVYQFTIGEQLTSEQQQAQAEEVPLVALPSDSGTADDNAASPDEGQVFAKLFVPRFGSDYMRSIAEGTRVEKVLNTVGLGHYSATQMPGEIGNFAIAGHRAGNGGPMRDIDQFVAGDLVYVETATTRFTYRFLQSKIVEPTEVGVINPEPQGLSVFGSHGSPSGGKFLTMTSCTPIYVNTQRIIAWFELVKEQPVK